MKKEAKNKLVACCVFLIGFSIAIFFMMLAFKPELLAFLKPYSLYIIFLMGGVVVLDGLCIITCLYDVYEERKSLTIVNRQIYDK